MIDINKIGQSNVEFADEIVKLSLEAKQFLESQKWCKKAIRGHFAKGVGLYFGRILF
jgi:hypothetical protein